MLFVSEGPHAGTAFKVKELPQLWLNILLIQYTDIDRTWGGTVDLLELKVHSLAQQRESRLPQQWLICAPDILTVAESDKAALNNEKKKRIKAEMLLCRWRKATESLWRHNQGVTLHWGFVQRNVLMLRHCSSVASPHLVSQQCPTLSAESQIQLLVSVLLPVLDVGGQKNRSIRTGGIFAAIQPQQGAGKQQVQRQQQQHWRQPWCALVKVLLLRDNNSLQLVFWGF